MIFERRRIVVYRLGDDAYKEDVPTPDGIEWQRIDQESIDRLFGSNQKLSKKFRRFLGKGFIGVVMHKGDEWVGYVWATAPGTGVPPHMPGWLRRLDNTYWVFHGRNREQYRSKGYGKFALRALCKLAYEQEKDRIPEVCVDMDVDNIASRRSGMGAGFQPMGTMTCYIFKVPKLRSFSFGRWDKDREHPPLTASGVKR